LLSVWRCCWMEEQTRKKPSRWVTYRLVVCRFALCQTDTTVLHSVQKVDHSPPQKTIRTPSVLIIINLHKFCVGKQPLEGLASFIPFVHNQFVTPNSKN
jgi:hypothetical protein